MRNNDQTNKLIKWSVILLDFVVMNMLIWLFAKWHPTVLSWTTDKKDIFFLACNLAMVVSEYRFYTVIHMRRVVSSDILRRLICLTVSHSVLAFIVLKLLDYSMPVVKVLFLLDTLVFFILLASRIFERWALKRYRMSGGNYRSVTLVGSDPELLNIS